MKPAAKSLDRIADFVGQTIDFRPGKVGSVETAFDKPDKETGEKVPSRYVEGDLISEDGTYHPNIRVFQAGLRKQLQDEIGEWVGGRLETIDTGKGNPMYNLDGEVVTDKVAKRFDQWEKSAPDFNDTDAPF